MSWLERFFLLGVLLAAATAAVLALSAFGVKIPLLDPGLSDGASPPASGAWSRPPDLPEEDGLLAELHRDLARDDWSDDGSGPAEPRAFGEAPESDLLPGGGPSREEQPAAAAGGDPPRELRVRRGRDPLVDEMKAKVDAANPGELLAFLIATTTPRGTKLGQEDLEFLFEALGAQEDWGVRNLLLTHLERIGGEGVTDGVLAFIEQVENPAAQARAFQTLRLQKDPRAVEGLVRFLAESDNRKLREAAFKNLLGTGSDAATEPLVRLLNDSSDPASRRYALAALSQLGGARGAEEVVRFAASRQPAERALGMKSLRDVRSPEAVPVLADSLGRSTDRALRRELVRALGRTRDERAVPSVAHVVLYEADRGLRMDAMRTLAQIGSASALPALEAISAGDANPGMQKAARRTITYIQQAAARRADRASRR